MGSRRTNNIEALSERLGSLQINEEASMEEYEQIDTEMSVAPATTAAVVMRTYRQDCQRIWYRTQGGSMETSQSLKTGGEGSDYFSKVTELTERTIGSQ